MLDEPKTSNEQLRGNIKWRKHPIVVLSRLLCLALSCPQVCSVFYFPLRNKTCTDRVCARDQSVKCPLISSLQLIAGFSMRNLTSGGNPDWCVSVTKLASFPRGCSHNRGGGGGCLQRCLGSPDGCLWRRYLCCRAWVRCQLALITGMDHPKPPHPFFSLSHLHWSKYDTFKSLQNNQKRAVSLLYYTDTSIGCDLLIEFSVISSLVHTKVWTQGWSKAQILGKKKKVSSDMCIVAVTAGHQVLIIAHPGRLAPRDPLIHTSVQVSVWYRAFLPPVKVTTTCSDCSSPSGCHRLSESRREESYQTPPPRTNHPDGINELCCYTAALCKDLLLSLFHPVLFLTKCSGVKRERERSIQSGNRDVFVHHVVGEHLPCQKKEKRNSSIDAFGAAANMDD